MKMITTIALET